MDLLRRAVPYLAYGYLSAVGLSSRIRWEGLEHAERLKSRKRNFIYAFWHARQALFTYTHRGAAAAVMVSKSKDGELIAEVMRLSGIRAVRGSSSRAAMAATRELIEAAAAGAQPGLTPDGPRGPARRVKPGVIYLAQKTGLPILPITNAASRKLVLKRSWDQFQVPLPFSRISVLHGAPLEVGPDDDPEAKALELEAALNRLTDEADRSVA